ncbi:MAG: IclR family transcriptional regulator [Ornithinimicrobium sp.]
MKPPNTSASKVQSIDRALMMLELIADSGGSLRLADLEAATGLPLPTVHRLAKSLVHNGYLRQNPSRAYALGPRLIRLGEISARGLGSWAKPHLNRAVAEIGETANLAVLEGDEILYVAQIPSPHSMRMFTEVGRRVSAHCSGVGKALLSQLDDDSVLDLLGRTGMPSRTANTITDPDTLLAEVRHIRERGWAVDHGEQEAGVWCIAAPIPQAPARIAISVSGPSGRLTEQRVAEVAPILCDIAAQLGDDLDAESAV